MLPQRNVVTLLRGPGGWLAVALLAVVALLFGTNLASSQQSSTGATLSAPALSAEAGEGAVESSWTAVQGAARYKLWVWGSVNRWQQLGGDTTLMDTT
jgi:hypothetical protein